MGCFSLSPGSTLMHADSFGYLRKKLCVDQLDQPAWLISRAGSNAEGETSGFPR